MLFEEVGVMFDRPEWIERSQLMELLYSVPVSEQAKKQPRSFFTKEQIKTGNYEHSRIRQFGMEELASLIQC